MDEGAAALGRRMAGRLMVRGERPSVRSVAEQLGVEIVEQAAPPPAQPGLRSEYRGDPPRIILYRDPIDLLAAAIHANQRFDMLACNLDELHIAHELCHHLEPRDRYGKLRQEESEEAAHAFAQELLNLSFDPRELHELRP